MKKIKRTNPELLGLVRSLRKHARENEANIWRAVAEKLAVVRSRKMSVNLSRINRYTKNGDTVVVPGKVLGTGKLEHRVTVAAFEFSEQAKTKILKAKGKCLSINELVGKNPKGSNVKIIG